MNRNIYEKYWFNDNEIKKIGKYFFLLIYKYNIFNRFILFYLILFI